MWKEAVESYPSICLKGLRKTIRNVTTVSVFARHHPNVCYRAVLRRGKALDLC
jgi:hypothetical protein